jgi:hypothetical protein
MWYNSPAWYNAPVWYNGGAFNTPEPETQQPLGGVVGRKKPKPKKPRFTQYDTSNLREHESDLARALRDALAAKSILLPPDMPQIDDDEEAIEALLAVLCLRRN